MKLRWNIKNRVTLLSIIPLCVMTGIISAFFIWDESTHHDMMLNDLGVNIALQISTASSASLDSKNKEQLELITGTAVANAYVHSITIIDKKGTVVIRKHKSSSKQPTHAHHSHDKIALHKESLIFMRPIFNQQYLKQLQNEQSIVPLNERLSSGSKAEEVIGWSIVELIEEKSRAQRWAFFKNGLVLAIFAIIIGIVAMRKITQLFTGPIIEITNTANELNVGNLEARVNTGAKDELYALERSINSIADFLKSSRDELQEKVDQATADLIKSIQVAELQNKELTLARKQALVNSKVKSEFLANMSHEIRTPMNGILGFVRLLRKTELTNEQYEHINTIEKSANNLLSIINDVLDIAKIESGKANLQNEEYNLRNCVEDVISLLAPSAYEKNLELISLFYNDVPIHLIGDETKVRQILTNIVGNAIKFTTHGEVIIRTMLEESKGDNVTLKISVNDTGIGINDNDLHRLFATFEQLDSSSTRQYSGTGLGLAISKTYAELMHGNVGVESALNKGSTFWFTFEHQNLENPIDHSKPSIPDANLKALKDRTVLMYDANKTSLTATQNLLLNWGMAVTSTHSYEKFTHLQQTSKDTLKYNVIVCALNQQEYSLEDLATRIEQIQNSNSYLIVTINSADPSLLRAIKLHGANACVSKPLKYYDTYKLLLGFFSDDNNIYSFPPATRASIHQESTRQIVEQHEESVQVVTKELSGVKILIAEDNDINKRLLVTLLEYVGASIKSVDNGKQAVDAIKEESFDIILMDIHMPEINGVEATKTIREQYKSDIPIIALTADAIEKDLIAFERAGISHTLIKPVDEDKLLSLIKQFHTDRSLTTGIDTKVAAPANSDSKIYTNYSADESEKRLKKKQEITKTFQDLLFKELPHFREQIINAYTDNDIQTLLHHTHKLHGAICYCDLPKLRLALQTLERSIKRKQYDQLEAQFETVTHRIDDVIASQNNQKTRSTS